MPAQQQPQTQPQSRTQQQQDAARIKKSTSLHSDVMFARGHGEIDSERSGRLFRGEAEVCGWAHQTYCACGIIRVDLAKAVSAAKPEHHVPVKTRDYTPQMPRSHAAQPIGLYSPGRGNLYLSQLSPHAEEPHPIAADNNILIQTLSPRGLKLYGGPTHQGNLQVEPKSTQHQDLMAHAVPAGGNRRANKQPFGPESKTGGQKQTKYQGQSKKAAAYESVIEQPIKSFLERRKPYY